MRFISLAAFLAATLVAVPAFAQQGGPPSVGVLKPTVKPITESSNFVGRVQATNKVDIVARVTGFMAERFFVEGGEVEKGALLYRLERAPFEADLAAKQATVAQIQALLRNAQITLGRAQSLLNGPAGQRSTVDDAQAQVASYQAQLAAAQAQAQTSQINLDYTEIHAPVSGKIGRTAFTPGNVVTPASGPITSLVSQDPMWITFPISVRSALELRNRYADQGGFVAVQVHVKLSDGTDYAPVGKVDYLDPSVASATDTVTMRAIIPNPLRPGAKPNEPGNRDLIDGSFVTVSVQGIQPVMALTLPRSAVLTDQQGNFVYVVDADNKAQVRRIKLGQSTPDLAVIASGVTDADLVITEGLQRVRAGAPVMAGPAGGPPVMPSGQPAKG